jgi:hypothetical protein
MMANQNMNSWNCKIATIAIRSAALVCLIATTAIAADFDYPGQDWQQRSAAEAGWDQEKTSQQLNPSYGYLWWLNGQSSAIRGGRKVDGPLNSSAPADLVAGLGALGRKCYVVPSLDLVVVRLGDNPEQSGQAQFDKEFWRLLMLARKS